MVAFLDFETYSECDITKCGAPVYAAHPSTEVLCACYDVGTGPRIWLPGDPPPAELLEHVAAGGRIAARNAAFEQLIWPRTGWPPVPLEQWECTASRARGWGLPGSLKDSGAALGEVQKKDTLGTRLITMYCCPQKDGSRRHTGSDMRLYSYCLQDIVSDADQMRHIPPLSDHERQVWLVDQRINQRGVAIDMESVRACAALVDRELAAGAVEVQRITGGINHTELAQLRDWALARGARLADMTAATIAAELTRGDLEPEVRAALQWRSDLSSASVKKIYALRDRVGADGRLRDVLAYCGAESTGRWAGRGPQTQNLPRPPEGWDADAALEAIRRGEATGLDVVKNSLRGLFVGHELVSSDYTAIEAVVLAALAGEQWRLDVFAGHCKIYEASAAAITGRTLQYYLDYKEQNGKNHIDRALGKVAELSSGFGGGVGAWLRFGAGATMSEDEIAAALQAWRKASPRVVQLWYALDRAACAAVRDRGREYQAGSAPVSYQVLGDTLYCRLPSGRTLCYHQPALAPGKFGRDQLTYVSYGRRESAWYGLLTENVVQAVARDRFAQCLLDLEACGYPVVMHTHDEPVCEGQGLDVAVMERIMTRPLDWCDGWPIRADGGWHGYRYRK